MSWKIVVAILLPLFSFLFLFVAWKYRQNRNKDNGGTIVKKDDKSENQSKLKKYIVDNWPALVALASCHFIVAYKLNDWYMVLFKNPVFWIFQIGIWFVYTHLRKDVGTKDKPRKELTPIGTFTLIIISLISLYSIFEWQANLPSKGNKATLSPTIPGTPWKPVLLPQGEPEGKDLEKVREFWKKHLPEKAEAEEMVIICRNESGGCNQFDASGEVMKNTNDNGTYDIGAMQINNMWLEKEIAQEKLKGNKEIESYDPETLDGNLQLALHYRKKYGLGPWSLGSKRALKSLSTVIIATPDDWSEEIETPRGFDFITEKEQSLMIKLYPSGEELFVKAGGDIRFNQPKAVSFKSIKNPATVFLTFK